MVGAVDGAVAVFAVPQQRTADLGHGHPDLMGPARQQAALYQRQRPPGLQGLIERRGGLAAGDGGRWKETCFLASSFKKKALDLPLGGLGRPTVMAEVGFFSISWSRIFWLRMRSVSAFLAAMTMPPVLRSMRLHRAGAKAFSPPGVPLPLLVEIGLDVVDEGIDLLRLVGVDHHAGALIHQQQIFILVDDVQPGLEHRQKGVSPPGGLSKNSSLIYN